MSPLRFPSACAAHSPELVKASDLPCVSGQEKKYPRRHQKEPYEQKTQPVSIDEEQEDEVNAHEHKGHQDPGEDHQINLHPQDARSFSEKQPAPRYRPRLPRSPRPAGRFNVIRINPETLKNVGLGGNIILSLQGHFPQLNQLFAIDIDTYGTQEIPAAEEDRMASDVGNMQTGPIRDCAFGIVLDRFHL